MKLSIKEKIYGYSEFKKLEKFELFKTCEKLPHCDGNYHIFYLLFKSLEELNQVKNIVNKNKFKTTTHYIPLHKSVYYQKHFKKQILPNADKFGKYLLRFPLYNDLKQEDVQEIVCIVRKHILENKLGGGKN